MMPQSLRWHVHVDASMALAAAAAQVESAARAAIASRGAFRIVLSGGETPRRLYGLLASAAADWLHWHIYWGDERCVPVGDPQRNDFMVEQAWLANSSVPRGQIHPIPAELGAEAGASSYAVLLRDVPAFDLVLLGLGEDGHTASLFPGHEWGERQGSPAALPVHGAPKPPADRVSLGAARLSNSRAVLVIAPGTGKAEAIRRWRSGEELPIAAIRPGNAIDVHLDALAAGTPGQGADAIGK